MRFTRLRLNGFKSFVDPTDLLIGDGLTGVVGPNGCGKSNLLEAMRWVMGENRASAMRGDGMEDVIFAGAATRPARNFAEVALTIDNSERLAPSGFNDQDQLEIVRRITRDAGSAFKANARDMRARDVQMLFADASTGSHSPALVRQGQIAELINAKPRNRRRILEEAAGISGLYQRRHEAELKLQATEANLLRVDDVIEQLAQQLAALARQARQAARYREIGAELRRAEGLLLFRRWAEADALRLAAAGALTDQIRATAGAETAARAAATLRTGREAALPPLREEEAIASAVLQRLDAARVLLADQQAQAAAAIAGLQSARAQLAQDSARETALNRDAGETIAALQAEAAALESAGGGHDARLAAAAEAARAAAEVLTAREAGMSELAEDVARLSARHHSAHRMRDDARTLHGRSAAEMARAEAAAEEGQALMSRAGAALQAAETAVQVAQATAASAETLLADAEAARADAQTREAEARAQRSGAEGEANAMRAEVAALARLVAREAQAGHQILDRLTVARGLEKALGAALADDLRAPEISAAHRSGWATLPAYEGAQPLPAGATPLSDHVQVPPVLLRRIGQIGLVDAARGAALQPMLAPGQRLVSREGDLWRWDGYRAAAADAPQASALRLQQLNRLVELKRDLEEVAARAEGARRAHEVLTLRMADLSRADQMARDARRNADRNLTEAMRAQSRAEADRSIAGGKLEAAALAMARHRDETAAAAARLAEAEVAVAALPDIEAARAAVEDIREVVEGARLAMLARRAAHDELRREGEARSRRRQEIGRDLANWHQRLDTAAARMAALDERAQAADADLAAALLVPATLTARGAGLEEDRTRAGTRRAAAADALAAAETALRDATAAEREAERAASAAREGRARAEANVEAAEIALAATVERIREAADCTPAALLEGLETDAADMPDAPALETEVARLRRQRDALGAVNLRAEDDVAEVAAEHDTLVREKADLEEAVRKLRAGISGLNREGRERLLTAFEQVNTNFRLLFTHLFGGGEANLVLVESDDPLEAGLEIMCQPPGKKLATLSLLSGGEQTLTALALIFAVFLANPAPICVLDEVDAPLDDANVTRFCDLLDEMVRRTDTRFLIITHHAVTMSRMHRLFGVTMAEQGVSQLVSVDLKRAEALVA